MIKYSIFTLVWEYVLYQPTERSVSHLLSAVQIPLIHLGNRWSLVKVVCRRQALRTCGLRKICWAAMRLAYPYIAHSDHGNERSAGSNRTSLSHNARCLPSKAIVAATLCSCIEKVLGKFVGYSE